MSPSLSQREPASFTFVFCSALPCVREVRPFNLMPHLSRKLDAGRKLRIYFKQMSKEWKLETTHLISVCKAQEKKKARSSKDTRLRTQKT